MFYLQKFNFWGRCPFMSGACDALNIKPGFDMTLLAYFKKSNPSKAVLPSPTGPLSLRMPSFCIELSRWPTNAWQKRWREQASQRPSRPQNQPSEERMRSTHPRKRQRVVVMHGTTATILKASPCLAKLCSNHKIFNTKINNFANLECFTNFCASKIWSYTV